METREDDVLMHIRVSRDLKHKLHLEAVRQKKFIRDVVEKIIKEYLDKGKKEET